jgi:hypothetical protein
MNPIAKTNVVNTSSTPRALFSKTIPECNHVFVYLTPSEIIRFGATCREAKEFAESDETIAAIALFTERSFWFGADSEFFKDRNYTDRTLKENGCNDNNPNRKLIYKICKLGSTFAKDPKTKKAHRYLCGMEVKLDRGIVESTSHCRRVIGRAVFLNLILHILRKQKKIDESTYQKYMETKDIEAFIKSNFYDLLDKFKDTFRQNEDYEVFNPILNGNEGLLDNIFQVVNQGWQWRFLVQFDLVDIFNEHCSLAKILELARRFKPEIYAGITNGLLSPRDIEHRDWLTLREFASEFREDPFSQRIKRALRERDILANTSGLTFIARACVQSRLLLSIAKHSILKADIKVIKVWDRTTVEIFL